MTADFAIDKPLPHSVEAERAILGAILLNGMDIDESISAIRPIDFFLPQHQLIFRHLCGLRDLGKPTNDTVLLYESLVGAGHLESAGGMPYVSQIPDGLPRVNNVAYYVEIVRGKAQLRRRAHIAQTIQEMALRATGNTGEILRDIGTLAAQLREDVGHERKLNFRSGVEIAMATDAQVQWIVPGFVACGAITEIGAKVKAGKTTLITELVRAVADRVEFLGRPTRRSSTVYLTEQPIVSFRQAMERAHLLGREDFYVLQYSDIRDVPWPQVVAQAVRQCHRVGATVLVIDTLPQFAGLKGDSENNSGDALVAMEPLLQAAAKGLAIIVVRHERKSGGEVGDSGRGSSAFAGAVDVVLSLRRPEGNVKKTQRVLQAVSRFSETPGEILLELTEGGYISLGEPREAALKSAMDSILAIAPKTELEALNLEELVESTELPRATTQRAVNSLLEEGLIVRIGKGKKRSPYRYWVGGNRSSPTHDISEQKETQAAVLGPSAQ